MKITRVTATPVTVGLLRPAATAMGSGTAITRTLVQIDTDVGLTGLGETAGAAAATLIGERFGPRVSGLDPRERETVRRACLPVFNDYGTPHHASDVAAFSGLEMALWDLLGKALELPLYKVLGGAVRDRAPFVAYAFAPELGAAGSEADVPDTLGEIAREQVALTGADMFEFKVARYSLDCDIAAVHAVRAAVGPDVAIGVDANMRYSVDDARRFLTATAGAGLANIEEPCATLADCARLRRDFGVPVSTHCTDMDALAAHPDIDSVVGAVDAQGGIAGTLELALAAATLGRRYWLRSCVELGVAWAAMVHLGMACAILDRPAQALMQWIEDDLVAGPAWTVYEGGCPPPETPGLGVELDGDAFQRHAELFASEGEKTYFDDA